MWFQRVIWSVVGRGVGIIVGIEGTNEAFRSGFASTGPRGGEKEETLEEGPSLVSACQVPGKPLGDVQKRIQK